MDVTVENSKAASFPEKLLLRALIISLIIHVAAFGGWKWAKAHGWLQHSTLPKWLQLISAKAIPAQTKSATPQQQPRATPLLFVDVDPSLAVEEPPKNAKYYSAASTQLASPKLKPDATMPEITGHQDKVLKTTENAKAKAKPLQPSPPEPEKTEKVETQARPKRADTPGDLAMAKPQPKPQENKGEADTDKGESAQPTHKRPRTLAEVTKSSTQGEKLQQSGGATRLAMDSSLDVTRTSYGNYDRELIDAIRNNWYTIDEEYSKHNSGNAFGTTVVEFVLWYDGRLTDVHIVANSSPEIPALNCKTAILNSTPLKPWPSEMRHEIGAESRPIRFTFYYLNH